MQFKRKIIKIGTSKAIVIPTALLEYLKMDVGDIFVVQDERGKHGTYLTMWKKGMSVEMDETKNEINNTEAVKRMSIYKD